MIEKYKVDGINKTFNVSINKKQDFLSKYPNAVLQSEEPSDQFSIEDFFEKQKSEPKPSELSVVNAMSSLGHWFTDSALDEEDETGRKTEAYEKVSSVLGDNNFSEFIADFSIEMKKAWWRPKEAETSLDLGRALGRGEYPDSDDIMAIYEHQKKIDAMGTSDAIRGYQKSYNENKEKHGGVFAWVMALEENPEFLLQTSASSIVSMVSTVVHAPETTIPRMLASGGVAASTALALGQAGPQALTPEEIITVPTAFLMGSMGGISGTMEQSFTFVELLREQLQKEGLDFTPENIKALLQDDKVVTYKDPRFKELDIEDTKANIIRRRSRRRGLAIGFVDTMTALLGGQAVRSLSFRGATKAKIGRAGTGVAIGGGLVSEVSGQTAGGQEYDAGEILTEGFAEKAAAMTGVTTLPTLLKAKSTYEINGELYTEKEFLEITSEMTDIEVLEALSDGNIKVENDKFNLNRIKSRANDGYYNSKIAIEVEDPADRKRLVELEKTRVKLEEQLKSKDSLFSNKKITEEKLVNIEKEINEIVGNYTALSDKKQTKARAEIKARGEEAMENLILKDTKEFLTKNLQFVSEGKGRIISADTPEKAQEAYNKFREEYNADPNNKNKLPEKDVTKSNGFRIGNLYVINKKIAASKGRINVGGHELLHGVVDGLFETMSKEERVALVKDFRKVLSKKQEDYVLKIIRNRGDLDENDTVEWFNIFSDGIKEGEISFDENLFKKIGLVVADLLRRFNETFGTELFGAKEFGSGRQVYNFLKDFSDSNKNNKEISARIQRVARKSAKQEDEYGFTELRESKDNTDEINDMAEAYEMEGGNKMWYDGGYRSALDMMTEQGLLDDLIFSATQVPIPNPLQDKFKNDVYAELTSHVRNYKPERNLEYKQANPDEATGLFGWINPQLRNKVLNVQKRSEYSPDKLSRAKDISETTEEGAPKIQLEADTTREETFIDEIGLDKKKDKYSQLRQDLGLEEKMMNKVRQAVIKTFGTKLPDINSKKFRSELEKRFRTELKKPIQDAIQGKDSATQKIAETYNEFLTKYFRSVYNVLPVATLTQMERNVANENRIFVKEIEKNISPTRVDVLISENKLPKDTNRTSGPSLFEKQPYPGKDKVMAFFRGVDMKNQLGYEVAPSTLGTRKDKLAMEIGVELAFDATSETIKQKDVQEKRKGILGLENKQQAENEAAIIAKQIDRDPSIKFSIDEKTAEEMQLDSSNSPFELLKILGITNPIKTIVEEYIGGKNKDQQKTRRVVDFQKLEKDIRSILDDFLEKHPYVHTFLMESMSGGRGISFFGTQDVFKSLTSVKNTLGKIVSRYYYSKKKFLEKTKFIKKNGKVYVKQGKKLLTWNEFSKQQKEKLDLLEKLFIDIQKYVKENPNSKWFWAAFVKDSVNNQSHFIRMVAPIMGLPVDKNGNIIYDEKIAEEHAMPQNNVATMLLGQALRVGGNIKKAMKIVRASYMQIALLEVDDTLVTQAGYKSSLPNIFWTKVVPRILNGSLKIKNGLASIIRYSESGVNLNNYFIPGENQRITEYFGVYIENATQFLIDLQNELITKQLVGEITKAEATKRINAAAKIKGMISKKEIKVEQDLQTSNSLMLSFDGETKGMSTFDFDETLIIDGENFVIATDPLTGQQVQISSAEWPTKGPEFAAMGYKFNFDDFVNVRGGVDGPLLQKMKNQIEKYGSKNVFVLTARPQTADVAIHEWLKSKDINIPFKNITGLADSRGEAKAEWMLEKFSEGYNDMYFVDDALPNVTAVKQVLDQLDAKSKVVQARLKFSTDASVDFNKMLERVKNISADKVFSTAEARKLGVRKGWFNFFVPPSAEDFKGLLYAFMGKGKQGDKDALFFKEYLLKPFAKAISAWNAYKQNMVNEYKQLRKHLPDVAKMLNKKVGDTVFTVDSAIRVYLWDKAGFEIPGLSQEQKEKLINYVNGNRNIKLFADTLSAITRRKEGYITPSENWVTETIASDLRNVVSKIGRKEFLAEWLANVNIIFSPENMNKIEAIYGTSFRDALEDMLFRMENGTNRNIGKDKTVNSFTDWINGSIGAIMFFNMRSALLQTISTINFINWSDNNIFKAAAAFANQVQFWKDFVMLFNSDQLKQRRAGLQIDVSASELTKSFAEGRSTPQAVIAYLLEIGFTPTQIADSFAIAFGGATFIRNRINTYIKQGMSEAKAKEQAMLDFQEIAEETQQSSREDLISQQQASVLGRFILAFQNVTMQYTRLTKKALSDIVNGRGDMKTNISKLIYYGAVQNIIFGALQTGLMFAMFGERDEEDIERKTTRVFNGALDSILRGTGIYGAMVSTLKNTIMRWQVEKNKPFGKREDWRIVNEMINLSPPIGSKIRKIMNAIKTEQYNKGVSKEIGVRIENPILSALSNVIEALTNFPLARMVRKANNIEEAVTGNHQTWQKIALALGWDKWSVGIKDEELEAAKQEAKKNRKIKNRKTKETKDKDLKTVRCSGINSSGKRCGLTTETKSKTWKCFHHAAFKDGMDRDGDGIKEYRCVATKANGQRCKNKTENKNKRCYAHQ